MIKTIAYNDFSDFDVDQKYNFEFMLNEFKNFVSQGGNLNLPILEYSDKIIPFEEWMRKTYSEKPEYFKELIDLKLIENPFNFILNHNNKSIQDVPNYGLKWLKSNFTHYRPYIIDAIKNLAQDIKDWDLGLNETDKSKRAKHDFPEYDFIDPYQSRNHLKHPLVHIANTFGDEDILSVILEASSQYKKLWQYYTDDVENLSGAIYNRLEHPDIAIVFYEHGIGVDYFNQPENYSKLHTLISHALYSDNLNFIKKYIHTWDIPAIEKTASYYDCFLAKTCSKEMTKLLMDNNAFVYGHFKDDDKEVSCLKSEMNFQALETIVENSLIIKEKLKNEPEAFFKLFFSQGNKVDFNKVKMLIEKFNFPVEEFDFWSVAYRAQNFTENFAWLLEHGADPRICDTFISNIVSQRAEGLKVLKSLHKSQLFNAFYPDPIFNIFHSQPTKDFTTWLQKADEEYFSRFNISGYPAWWGVNNINGMSLVADKVKDFTQLSQTGLSWPFYIFRKGGKKNYSSDYDNVKALELFKKKHEKNAVFSLDLSGHDSLSRNLFHYAFQYEKYKREEVDNKLMALILENTNTNIAELLIEKDQFGRTPLELMVEFLEKTNMWNVRESVQNILSHSMKQFDFGHLISVDGKEQSVYEVCKFLLSKDEKKLAELDQYYNSWKLYHKLDSSLNSDNYSKSNHKVKI